MTNPSYDPNAGITSPQQGMSFTQSMNRLQQIVSMLNNPNLELEEAMKLFKEGLELSRSCQIKLDDFESQMNQLLDSSKGEPNA